MKTSHLAICFFLLTALLPATTVVPVSVEQLAHESSHIVEGRALESWSQWNPQHTLIFTYTRFQVTRALKGQPPSTLVVKQLGGEAGGYIQKIPGVRQWRTGEQAVLFLQPSLSQDGTLQVTGLMQGNFAVRTTPAGEIMVSNGVSGVSAYKVGGREVTPYQGNTMRLQDLEARIQKSVQQ